jgi:A/G-specific adenine glycosylase
MELGAVICLPNGTPLCEKCPVMHLCKAFKLGIQMDIPVKKPKKARRIEEKTILLFSLSSEENLTKEQEREQRKERFVSYYAIQKRRKKGLLAGMWQLPAIEGKKTILELEEYLKQFMEKATIQCEFDITPLEEGKHIFSHVEWHMKGYKVQIRPIQDSKECLEQLKESINEMILEMEEGLLQELKWIQSKDLEEVALPSAYDLYRGYLQ